MPTSSTATEDPPRLTYLEVSRAPDGTWRVTQPGADVVGRGASAARAAEDYCAAVARRVESDAEAESGV